MPDLGDMNSEFTRPVVSGEEPLVSVAYVVSSNAYNARHETPCHQCLPDAVEEFRHSGQVVRDSWGVFQVVTTVTRLDKSQL